MTSFKIICFNEKTKNRVDELFNEQITSDIINLYSPDNPTGIAHNGVIPNDYISLESPPLAWT